MAETLVLKAELRENVGGGKVRRLRKDGKVPAVLYGKGGSRPIQLKAVEVVEALKTTAAEQQVVDLELSVSGQKANHLALIQEIQTHPIKDKVLHIDFHEIDKNQKIHAEVAVHEVGEAAGVKKSGGLLEHLLRTLEVECLPMDLPDHIDVDVSHLEIDDAIHVKEISLPQGVTVLNAPDLPVFMVHAPRVSGASTASTSAAAEPEVISEKKEKDGASSGGEKKEG